MDLDLIALVSWLKQLWTVWLVLIFAGIAIYAFWPGNREKFDRAARMPLDDDDRIAARPHGKD
jgi:cytochrome c oxidase cbb3-type subunit 4